MQNHARALSVIAILLPAIACGTAAGERTGQDTANVEGTSAVQGRVSGTGGMGLRVRAEPNTSASTLDLLSDGDRVSITCQTNGESVNGNDVWDYIEASGGYVADAYVVTGYDGFVPSAKRCGTDDSEAEASEESSTEKPRKSNSSARGTKSAPIQGGFWVQDNLQALADGACGTVGACLGTTYAAHQPTAARAVDILVSDAYGSVPSDGNALGDALAEFVVANMSEYKVWYVIFRQRINYGAGWQAMEDRSSWGNPVTQNHLDHVHVSVW